MASQTIEFKLKQIARIFDIEKVAKLNIDKDYIQKYYKVNSVPYSIFHTKDNFMYMGISRDGIYKKEDLKAHTMFIDSYIKKCNAKNVLEIASGRSASTNFLAQINPNVNFYGVELSDGQYKHAKKRSRFIANVSVQKGDYHDLSMFKDSMFDTVYVIEALCYSTNKEQVFREVHRVLNKNGLFIIFDGYRNSKTLSSDEKIACNLTEKSMALQEFESYQSTIDKSLACGFIIDYEEDLSKYVLPTMKRFEKLSKAFFYFPPLSKLLAYLLPKEFVLNSIAGYLMPNLIESGIAKYMITVLKPSSQ